MFRTLYNQALLQIRIEPDTPILIKTGRESFDPTRPDMEFTRTRLMAGGQYQEVPYLPGSSLKGVIRSHAERILRTLCPEDEDVKLWACDITSKEDNAVCVPAGSKNQAQHSAASDSTYDAHCYACRTFGYMKMASRVRFTDAYPWKMTDVRASWQKAIDKIVMEERVGVMIDRRKGSVAHGPFQSEVCTAGQFHAEISLRNYQLWQLALIALVLRDMNRGYQRLGAAKSRGLGRVNVYVDDFEIQQFGRLAVGGSPALCGIGEAQNGYVGEDRIDSLDAATRVVFDDGDWNGVTCRPQPDKSTDGGDPGVNNTWNLLAKQLVGSKNWQNLRASSRRKLATVPASPLLANPNTQESATS